MRKHISINMSQISQYIYIYSLLTDYFKKRSDSTYIYVDIHQITNSIFDFQKSTPVKTGIIEP
jgi:hypothetical protein